MRGISRYDFDERTGIKDVNLRIALATGGGEHIKALEIGEKTTMPTARKRNVS